MTTNSSEVSPSNAQDTTEETRFRSGATVRFQNLSHCVAVWQYLGRQQHAGAARAAAHMQQPGAGAAFRVTLSMKKEPDGGPVYCKMEQTQRFKQLKTVKLQTDTTYRIDVSFKPPRALQSLVIQGQEMAPCERARDSTACAYSSYYNTDGLSPSKKGHREDLTIIMKVQGSGELSTCLQIKLYKQRDTQHCEWGSRLHCIELDCTSTEGAEGVRVNRETYRKLGLDS